MVMMMSRLYISNSSKVLTQADISILFVIFNFGYINIYLNNNDIYLFSIKYVYLLCSYGMYL